MAAALAALWVESLAAWTVEKSGERLAVWLVVMTVVDWADG